MPILMISDVGRCWFSSDVSRGTSNRDEIHKENTHSDEDHSDANHDTDIDADDVDGYAGDVLTAMDTENS